MMGRDLTKWDGDSFWRVEWEGLVTYYPKLPGENSEDLRRSLREGAKVSSA